ncbi:MAG: TonB-dependent receptor [Melioribacteraceae bacterium]|nr:TonB-dependent receptor [Melioribacteraceae bacterium]
MSHSIKSLQILLVIIFTSISIFGQSGTLKGIVTASDDGQPLTYANVMIVGTTLGNATTVKGEFIIKNIPVGEVTIKASYLGYESKTEVVEILPNKTIMIEIELEHVSIEGEEVVVTAQAAGQMAAINQQLNSNQIVNVVSSAKIQEIPDANAAETVGRLPGVSIIRSGGEGNKVVIRGLSPKYNSIQLNGVKLPSTGSGDRSSDISMISPYMLEGIEVIKAVTADQDADVIGGAVNFKLKKAPSGFRFNGIAQGGYNGLEKSFGDYKFVLSGSNRFFDNKLGIFAQADVERRNRSADVLSASHYIPNASLDIVNKVYVENVSVRSVERNRDRYGGSLVFDYQLDNGEIVFSNFVSRSNTDVFTRQESFSVSSLQHNYGINDNSNELSIINNALKFEYDFGFIKADATVSNSFSENHSPLNLSINLKEKAAFATPPADVEDPSTVIDYAKNDIYNTLLDEMTANSAYTKENHTTLFANFEFDLNFSDDFSSKIKFGGKYRHQEKYNDASVEDRAFQPYQYTMDSILANYPWMHDIDVGSASRNRLPFPLFIDPSVDQRAILDGQFNFGPAINRDLVHDMYNFLRNTIDINRIANDTIPLMWKSWPSSIRDDYRGTEDYSAAYIMAEINIGKDLMILPGVRYENNITEYTASRGDDAIRGEVGYNYRDTTTTRNNSFWLPSVHVKYDATSWLNFRFAYTNTLTRPNYNRITPYWHHNSINSTLSWHNYRLRPGQSENFDLSATIHDNYLGFFNVGVFYKNIKDLVYSPGQKVVTDNAEYDLPEDMYVDFITPQVNNKYDAEIKGIELDWQTHFWYLPAPFDGIVLDINYTHIESETKYPRNEFRQNVIGYDTTFVFGQPRILPIEETVNVDTFYTGRVVNQPSDIINISLGYDYKGFSGRVSMQYTDDILRAQRFYDEETRFTDTYIRWDLALKQKLPIKGLQVFYNLNNFTNALDRDYLRGNSFASGEEYYGMTMDLGIRYSF